MDLVWNVLDVGSIWMKEFAAALQAEVEVNAWSPSFGYLNMFSSDCRRETLAQPPLQTIAFPLQRGYAHPLVQRLAPFQQKLLDAMMRATRDPYHSPLVCSSPFYEPVAAHWPGPVVYYATDLTMAYPNLDATQVVELDRRLCARATFVCPNSRRIAAYFVRDAGCSPAKVKVIPNATRRSNISAEPLNGPAKLPAGLEHLSHPIIGVLGDLSANTDWLLLLDAVERTPDLHWVFVGPTRPIADARQACARAAVQTRAHFTGMKPYGELQAYARCFDVAVLPYRRSEPTYSGSSTRFYEHLAAGRPMIGTRGFAELEEKVGLIHLVDTAEELVERLQQLRQAGFVDGCELARWRASREGTWTARAQSMRALFASTQPSNAGDSRWAREMTFNDTLASEEIPVG